MFIGCIEKQDRILYHSKSTWRGYSMDDMLYRIDYFYNAWFSNKIINQALCNYEKKINNFLKPKQKVCKDLLDILYVSSNLIMRKEETIEEIANKYKLKVSKVLIDGMITQIASSYNEDGSFTIGDIKFNDPIGFINTLRNKFAHGRYRYFPDRNAICMKANGGEMYIPLDFLVLFNRLLFVEINKIKNDGYYYEGIIKIKKNSLDQIKNYNNFKKALSSMTYHEFIITPTNDNVKYEEYENGVISKIIGQICDDFNNEKDPSGNIRILKKYCTSLGLNLDYNITPCSNFKEEEKVKLKNMYFNTTNFNDFDRAVQVQAICGWIIDIKVIPNPIDHISQGYTITQNFVEFLDYDKSYEMFAKEHPKDVFFYDKSAISTILAQFNIVYAYNAELLYEKYLDYSKLDLSKIKYTINKFEDLELASLNGQLEVLKSRMDTASTEVEKAKTHLDRLMISINKKKDAKEGYAKGEEVLTQCFKQEEAKLEEIRKQYEEILLKKQLRKEEINNNREYYENKNIIAHIRNALAHGNFEVERFTKEGNLGNAKIHIQDIYMGENTFDLDISMNEFVSLFNRHNYKVIFSMHDELTIKFQEEEKNKKNELQENKLHLK
jgi:hypothetical protein